MGLTFPQGCACVYIRITMVTMDAYVPPCGKVSPANIANGRQSWTDIKFSSTGGIPSIINTGTYERSLLCAGLETI